MSVIIDFYHRRVGHSGRGMTKWKRSNGFWVISCTAAVKSIILKCIDWRKYDLPEDWLIEELPFSNCGVDMCGSFPVKGGWKIHNCYHAMFICLCSCAVHIEATNSMTTGSFIQALGRLISRSGNIRNIQSDNDSNFVGTIGELKKTFSEMDKKNMDDF